MSGEISTNISTDTLVAENSDQEPIKTYKRRWFMLLIFMLYELTNTWQWIQYSIVTNVIMKYYNVSSYAVDWTSIIFLLAYIPTIIPASIIMDKKGLRWTLIAGSLGTALGAWIKVASLSPNLFWLAYTGQTITALAQTFLLALPPHVASTWFPSRQVATACSLGVLGNQVGVASGFVFTPMIVRYHDKIEDIEADLRIMYYFMAGLCTVSLVLILLFFQEKPPRPPSIEMLERQMQPFEFVEPMKELLRNKSFILLMISYGISQGLFNAISTLLNRLILIYFQDGEEFAGRIGMIIVFGGLIGGVVCGVILDKTHKYKETAVVLYILTLLSILGFSFVIQTKQEIPVYVVSLIVGVTLNGYVPVGYEFVSEVTYPVSENKSTGVLMCATQAISMLMTMVYGPLIDAIGDTWANVFMCSIILVGCVITIFIPADLRRLAAQQASLQVDQEKTRSVDKID